MAVICEIIDSVVCWKIHGCGCVADHSPRGKSGLRWISASTMTLWYHLNSTSDPDELPNQGPAWPV